MKYPDDGLHLCPFCGTPSKALWELNYQTSTLRVGETTIKLPPMQCDLLAALCDPAGRVVSKERLISRMWGSNSPFYASKLVEVYVHHLRRKLAGTPFSIATVRSEVYVLHQKTYEPITAQAQQS
jgi:two-component system response regulator TctD